MSRDDHVQLDGEVVLVAAGGSFRVRLENGHEVVAQLAGRMRRNRLAIVQGDRVTVAVSPYHPSRGMIVYRDR